MTQHCLDIVAIRTGARLRARLTRSEGALVIWSVPGSHLKVLVTFEDTVICFEKALLFRSLKFLELTVVVPITMVLTLVYRPSLEEVSALHIGCPVKITLPATSDWVTSGTVDHLLDRECTAQSLVGVRTPPFSSLDS